LELVN